MCYIFLGVSSRVRYWPYRFFITNLKKLPKTFLAVRPEKWQKSKKEKKTRMAIAKLFALNANAINRSSRPELSNIDGKRLCRSLFFNKTAGMRPAALLKKRLEERCFPKNFGKFLRTPFCITLEFHIAWYYFSSKLETLIQYRICQSIVF